MRGILVLFAAVFVASAISLAELPEKSGAEVKGIVTDTNRLQGAATVIFSAGSQSYPVEDTGEDSRQWNLDPVPIQFPWRPHRILQVSASSKNVAEKGSQINFDFQLWGVRVRR